MRTFEFHLVNPPELIIQRCKPIAGLKVSTRPKKGDGEDDVIYVADLS